MIITDDIFSISVLVTFLSASETKAQEIVTFKVLQQGQHFKAIPLLSEADRTRTGLPDVFSFAFSNRNIIPDGEVNGNTMEVMRKMIWELSILEVLDLYE